MRFQYYGDLVVNMAEDYTFEFNWIYDRQSQNISGTLNGPA